MPEIVLGNDSNPGGRRYNEDRSAVEIITTPSGKQLAVAVVCDGVGGEARGERAAQLGVDTFMATMRQANGTTDTVRLLVGAVKQANAVAYAEACRLGQEGRMAATLVAAVIEDGERLFVAAAGDSRAYLVRNGKLGQLTRDHSFANVMVWLGQLSQEAADKHPDANKVMRVLAIKPELQVDVGIYLDTLDYGEANRIGLQGFHLEPGDSVLLCSDGLIKKSPRNGVTLITDDEIVELLKTYEGEAAARAIMGQVLGRIPVGDPVDNVTVATLQTHDPSRAAVLGDGRPSLRRMALVAAAVAVPLGLALLVVMVAFGAFFVSTGKRNAATATHLALATQSAAAQTAIVAAYTPTPTPSPTITPTPTPRPTAVPTAAAGEVAKVFSGDEFQNVVTDDPAGLISVPAGETRYIAVTYLRYASNVAEDANLYLAQNSQLQFDVVTTNQIQVILLPGSNVFVQPGPYPRGVDISLANLALSFSVRDGCLALRYTADNVLAGCYDGQCSYVPQVGASPVAIGEGQQVTINFTPTVTPAGPETGIEADTSADYWSLLSRTSVGRQDAQRCGVPDLEATATAQARTRATSAARQTASAATRTPAPTATASEAPPTQRPADEPRTSVPPTAAPSPTVAATTESPPEPTQAPPPEATPPPDATLAPPQ